MASMGAIGSTTAEVVGAMAATVGDRRSAGIAVAWSCGHHRPLCRSTECQRIWAADRTSTGRKLLQGLRTHMLSVQLISISSVALGLARHQACDASSPCISRGGGESGGIGGGGGAGQTALSNVGNLQGRLGPHGAQYTLQKLAVRVSCQFRCTLTC